MAPHPSNFSFVRVGKKKGRGFGGKGRLSGSLPPLLAKVNGAVQVCVCVFVCVCVCVYVCVRLCVRVYHMETHSSSALGSYGSQVNPYNMGTPL